MKPSHAVMLAFAIVLAVGALTIGNRTVAPISSAAVTDEGQPPRWCGAAACAPGRIEPETYR